MVEFLHMGGYAFYVWSSFGLVTLVLGANAVWPLYTRQALEKEIRTGLVQQAGAEL